MAGRGIYTYWPDLKTNDLGTYTLPIDLLGNKKFKINFYERNFTTPTRSKIFTVRQKLFVLNKLYFICFNYSFIKEVNKWL